MIYFASYQFSNTIVFLSTCQHATGLYWNWDNKRRKHHPDSDDHQACGQKEGTGGNWVQKCQNFTAFERTTP